MDIKRSKILKLSEENLNLKNDEIQVVHVECESLKEATTQIGNFDFKNYLNVFVITIKLRKPENVREELENLIIRKITDDRPIIVEISSEEGPIFRVKHRGESVFSTINLNIEDFRVLTIDVLLHILNNSLLSADYSRVILHFKDTNVDPIILALNAGDELSFRLIKLFKNEEFSQEIQGKLLFSPIKSNNFGIFLAAMNAFNETQVTKEQIKELLSIELDSHCAFMIAVESKNEKVVKFLLKFVKDFPDFFTFKLFEESLEAIKKREFFVIFDDLKKSEFKSTNKEKNVIKKIVNGCKTILSDITKLHRSIKDKKLSDVKEFVKKYPSYRLCYGKSQINALDLTIDSKCFDIYAYLRSEGFYTDKGDKLNTKIQALSNSEKIKIRNENLKHVVSNPEACIGIILSKCNFDPQSPIASSDVREMLLKFKEIDEINSTFPTIAHADFKTIFDYVNESVSTMDPNGDEFTLGKAYFSKGLLYVGKNASKNQRYGTFAHEMMHFVLFLVFENKCLPYCEGDTVREAQWVEIVKKVKQEYEKNPESTENIIKWVFLCYDPGYEQSAETAVRVNDMLAFHHDNQAKIEELEGLHPELFSFIRTKVLPDLKIPNVYRMIKLNNDFGLLQKIEDSELQVKPTEELEILDLATEDNKRILIVTNVPQLILSKILQEIKNLAGNKLNLKARNIFVDAKVLEQKHVKEEFFSLIDTTNVDRIIADYSNIQEILNTLKPEVQCFFVASKVDEELVSKYNFTQHVFNIQWQELTEKSQNFILNKSIRFQRKYVKLSKTVLDNEKSITPEILKTLCSDNEIRVNCESNIEKIEKFIERTVQMKKKIEEKDKKKLVSQERTFFKGKKINEQSGTSSSTETELKNEFIYEDFSLQNFLIKSQNEPILVISDVAGSGKTTLLRKVYEMLIEKFPFHFIIFIPLLKYVDELTEGVGENFPDFIAKALKFDVLEREIFMQKYKKGEVKILFDAFDEISPKCKENTTKLFQNFIKNGKNQIFITTRTHLEHDLEKDLKILAYRIKTLAKEEQIKFVVEFWKHPDRDLVEKYAKLLVHKISEIIATKTSLIGVPLIVQGLAEAYKDKIDENFEREIENLDISSVYEKLIETFFNILTLRFPQNLVVNQKKTMSLLQVHQYFAVCLLFSEEFANSLGWARDGEEWSNEEIVRCGLIKYDKDGKFHFNHQTYAEFLISGFSFHILKTVKKLSSVIIDFIFKVLTDKKFQIMRMFLDSMLSKVENVQDMLSFNSSFEICQKVENEKKFLHFCAREGIFNVFVFFAMALKNNDRLFKEVLKYKDNNQALSVMLVLPHATNLSKFEILFDEVLNIYPRSIFNNILSYLYKTDNDGHTILHYFAADCKSSKIFESFWNKIEKKIKDEAKLRKFLLLKGTFGGNALLVSIARQNQNSFYFLFEVFCKFFTLNEFAFEINEFGENLLDHLTEYGSTSMYKVAFEKLKTDLLKEGYNILECNQDKQSFKFFWNVIKNEDNCGEVMKILSDPDSLKHLLLHQIVKFENFSILKLFFSLYEQSFDKVRILQFFREKDEDGDNLLHRAAEFSKSKEVFEFLWIKIEELFEVKEELKKFLLMKGKYGRNALLQSIAHQNENSFYFLFEQVYCKYFSIKEFAYESDEDGENIFCYLVHYGSDSMREFAFEKLKIEFIPDFFQNLETKQNKNTKSVKALVNFIEYEVKIKEFFTILGKSKSSQTSLFPLMVELYNLNNLKTFKLFFALCEQIFSSDQILKLFLEGRKEYSDNFLHHAAVFAKSKKVFEFLWMKIEELFEVKQELKKFLLMKGKYGRNALLQSIAHQNENSFYFLFEQVFRKIFSIKEFAYETDEDGENIFCYLVHYGSDSMREFAFKKLEIEFLIDKQNKNTKSVYEVKIKEFFTILGKYKSFQTSLFPLMVELYNLNNLKTFELFEQYSSSVQILKLFQGKNKDGDNLLHVAAKHAESKENFEFLYKKIEKLFEDKEDLKKFLLMKGRYKEKALILSVTEQNENSFYFLFEEVFCKIFDIKEFVYENDEHGENLLHCLARCGSISMLKFALKKLKNEFSPEDLQNFMKLRSKNGHNLLHCAAQQYKNEEPVIFLVNFIKDEVGSEEIKKMLSELDILKYLPLHYTVENSSKVFEFLFSFYESNFSIEEIKSYMIAPNFENKNILTMMCEYKLEFLNEVFQKMLNEFQTSDTRDSLCESLTEY